MRRSQGVRSGKRRGNVEANRLAPRPALAALCLLTALATLSHPSRAADPNAAASTASSQHASSQLASSQPAGSQPAGAIGARARTAFDPQSASAIDPQRPFASDSPWNVRPVNPVLGDYVLPATRYHPYAGPGDYSTGVFVASLQEAPATIFGPEGDQGTWCADAEIKCVVTLPHWPARVQPARGTDGHADIIDPTTGTVNSFWQLRRTGSTWRAEQYAWTRLDGRGWGDPAHYQQGARAAGVPTLGGLIRSGEIDDGQPIYSHALALSLDGSALKMGYVFPATSEDNNAARSYRGQIPMGSLLMLPAAFDVAALHTPALQKIARTLQRYGARVVDSNTDTRFNLYVENGSGFDLHHGGWDSAAADDLDRIATALRPLRSQSGWLDREGRAVTLTTRLNLVSLRGPWTLERGGQAGRFDSARQALLFDAGEGAVVQSQRGGNGFRPTPWQRLSAGHRYRFTVSVTGDATLALSLADGSGAVRWSSGALGNGGSVDFNVAGDDWRPQLTASRRQGPARISARLVEVD